MARARPGLGVIRKIEIRAVPRSDTHTGLSEYRFDVILGELRTRYVGVFTAWRDSELVLVTTSNAAARLVSDLLTARAAVPDESEATQQGWARLRMLNGELLSVVGLERLALLALYVEGNLGQRNDWEPSNSFFGRTPVAKILSPDFDANAFRFPHQLRAAAQRAAAADKWDARRRRRMRLPRSDDGMGMQELLQALVDRRALMGVVDPSDGKVHDPNRDAVRFRGQLIPQDVAYRHLLPLLRAMAGATDFLDAELGIQSLHFTEAQIAALRAEFLPRLVLQRLIIEKTAERVTGAFRPAELILTQVVRDADLATAIANTASCSLK